MSEVKVFECGLPRDHKCDDNGPVVYGGSDVPTTSDKEIGRGKGYSWGSVTCSVCGLSAMERSYWEDWE